MSVSDNAPLQRAAALARCAKCGALWSVSERRCHCTTELNTPLAPITERIDRLPTTFALNASHQNTLGPTHKVLLQFLPSGFCVPLSLDSPMILGRRSTPDQTPPHRLIDLCDLDAEKRGVSRQHCQLERQGTLLFIIDLNSTNGTHLNGERLAAHTPYRLADGDRLILSTLHLTVSFATSPVS